MLFCWYQFEIHLYIKSVTKAFCIKTVFYLLKPEAFRFRGVQQEFIHCELELLFLAGVTSGLVPRDSFHLVFHVVETRAFASVLAGFARSPVSPTWRSCLDLGDSQCYTWTSPSVTSPWWASGPSRCPELPPRAPLKTRRETEKCTFLLLNVPPFTHLGTTVNSIQLFVSISLFSSDRPLRWMT